MPGRRNPEPTESEKTREYRLEQKRGSGEVGEGTEALPERGGAAEVRREREAWKEAREDDS